MQVFDNLNTYTFGEIRDVAEQWSIAIEAKNKYVENKEGSAEDFRESHHEYDSAVDEYRKISGYLARIEHFALGVNIGIYDARVTERSTTTYFVMLFSKLMPILEVKNGGSAKDTEVVYISKVKYLGYIFYRYKGKCRFRVHPKSVAKMKNRIRELTNRNKGISNEIREKKYQEYVRDAESELFIGNSGRR